MGPPVMESDVRWQQSHVGRQGAGHISLQGKRGPLGGSHGTPDKAAPSHDGGARPRSNTLPAHSPSSSSENINVKR